MRLRKLTVTMLAALAALGGLASEAMAGGDAPDCLVTNKGELAGKQKITGTAVVELINLEVPTAGCADAALLLRFGDAQGVFRAHVPNPQVTSPEMVMCEILAAGPTMVRASDGAELTIFQAFGIPTSKSLKLCLVVDPATQKVTCLSVEGLDFSIIPGTGNNWSGVSGLTIFVLD